MPQIHRNPHGARYEHKTPLQSKQCFEFLYEEGAQTSQSVAENLGVGLDRARVILDFLIQEGKVERFRRVVNRKSIIFYNVPAEVE